eukprot:Lithocolla_globosa_v1_NODE_1873_length_2282_cov_108.426325.p1 type:complete len:360 gc:universal NODE_1873_length_2282_cov_108.426325:102-1181(+)
MSDRLSIKNQHLSISQAVFREQATEAVKLHAVYAAVFLGYPQYHVAELYGKSPSAISKWVSRWEREGSLERHKPDTQRFRKLLVCHREWVISFVKKSPLSYLHEICQQFHDIWGMEMSSTSAFVILEEAGYSLLVLERRAMEISFDDVVRFMMEVNALCPLPHQLCFLDEMSTDNRAMLRKRGWFIRGSRPVWKSFFRRGTRISVLSFLGVDGLFESFETSGTFDRQEFFRCCKQLLDSGKVQKYPGRNSIWILDGASIHVDCAMIEYFQSRGILVIFLPAYCPFFNPIEVIFGEIKRRCRLLYSRPGTEHLVLLQVLKEFSEHDCLSIFKKCGFMAGGYFDPTCVDEKNILKAADYLD